MTLPASRSPTSCQNERYCGDKLLQKRFVEDYISHREKMNEGELPMYYIEDCHEAIVDRSTFRWVQEESGAGVPKGILPIRG